jgi:hypothetical protein
VGFIVLSWVLLYLVGSFVFWALGVVGFFGLALVVSVYTSCDLGAPYAFL